MTSTSSDGSAQLAEIDGQIEELRGQAASLREQIGPNGDGATEPEERAAVSASALELDTIIGELQARRDRLAAESGGG
ncbi:hypothetical protein F4553_001071 [Allocatelliglobosispora scoriae]|uniref:Uncharacterized protein n=1 Tax=Allocatelliglobosispora scoriae TaxID=643052 RepID=A0A841BLR6_9ACTN|nr:hypothetical protein [Allocatelliglobosispora scoriae]MBB5867692.1 hypothetical protein [Allocatelliglobosispora scoriae]